MPRILLMRQSKLDNDIAQANKEVRRLMGEYRIKNKDIAELCGISEQAIWQQINNERITLQTYLAVKRLINERISTT